MKKIGSGNHLVIAFMLLIIIIILISALAVSSLYSSNMLFEKMYKDPVALREAALKANTILLDIQSALGNAVTLNQQLEITSAIFEMQKRHSDFINQFINIYTINNRYKVLMNNIIDEYSVFKSKTDTLIYYLLNGNYTEAISYNRATLTDEINIIKEKMQLLINETVKDADAFYNTSQKQSYTYLIVLSALTVLAVLISIIISINISKKILAYEKALYAEKERFKVILHSIGDAVIATDTNKKILMMNYIAEKFTGWTQHAATGKSIDEVFNLSHEDGVSTIINPIDQVLETDQICELSNSAILTSKDGTVRNIADSAAPIKDENGETTGVVIVFRDETENKKKSNKIKYMSYHDILTGLYSRTFYEMEIERLNNSDNLPVSVIMGDINGLKLINDVYGHHAGDELLKKISDVLISCVPDNAVVSRCGGDEFAVLLPSVDKEEANRICDRIKKTCIERSDRSNTLSISLGTATKESADEDLYMLIKIADDNMYNNKLSEGKQARRLIVDLLRETLALRSFETEEHINSMFSIMEKIKKSMLSSKHEIDEMRLLILLHDIGEIVVSDDILSKPSSLTDKEWDEIKKHPDIGYRISRATDEFASIADLILTHHERWDSSGYPHGLKGEEIPRIARIFSIIDAYNAMTTTRPYRKAISHAEALMEISRCAGTQFDPELAKEFIELLS